MEWLDLNLDAYRILGEILNDTRLAIQESLKEKHGSEWFRKAIPSAVFDRLVSTKEGETAIDVVAYAAQIACQLGAHIVKVKPPTAHIELAAAKKVYDKAAGAEDFAHGAEDKQRQGEAEIERKQPQHERAAAPARDPW